MLGIIDFRLLVTAQRISPIDSLRDVRGFLDLRGLTKRNNVGLHVLMHSIRREGISRCATDVQGFEQHVIC